ncbi:MAG: hypothetical protein ABIK33_01835 [candidate division WOR-3 bacterium]
MRQRILLIVLGVVILLAIYTFVIRKPSARVNKAVSTAKAKVTEKAASGQLKDVAKSVKEPLKSAVSSVTKKPAVDTVKPADTEIGKWGVDPFVRDWVVAGEISNLKLKAISKSGSKAYALINDQILEVGEVILGMKIIAIENDKVILEQSGNKYTVLLGQ